jgi:hypothetical protein
VGHANDRGAQCDEVQLGIRNVPEPVSRRVVYDINGIHPRNAIRCQVLHAGHAVERRLDPRAGRLPQSRKRRQHVRRGWAKRQNESNAEPLMRRADRIHQVHSVFRRARCRRRVRRIQP